MSFELELMGHQAGLTRYVNPAVAHLLLVMTKSELMFQRKESSLTVGGGVTLTDPGPGSTDRSRHNRRLSVHRKNS